MPCYTSALRLSFLATTDPTPSRLLLLLDTSPWMPLFLQRLVVSLETLNWMHTEAVIRDKAQGFAEMLFIEDPGQNPSGILGTYYQSCMAINNLKSVVVVAVVMKNSKVVSRTMAGKVQGDC